MKRIFLLFFVSLLLPLASSAQCDYCIGGKTLVELRRDFSPAAPRLSVKFFQISNLLFLAPVQKTPMQSQLMTVQSKLPKTWCYDNLAFFCRMEVKLENAVNFPIKFRLGDVQYVDRLEGKY